MYSIFSGITGRVTARVVLVVSGAILITAVLGFIKLYQVTESNSLIRIDRAARAATAVFTEKLSQEFSPIYQADGTPLAIRLISDTVENSLSFRDQHDELLKQIGSMNQGAANLFKLNPNTHAFDRFATTFRKPDGSVPPAMSIREGHPAYQNLIENRPHLGEVPVMGRLRLAYLTPIQSQSGAVVGALAVDVGWVDDLTRSRNELQTQIAIAAVLIIIMVTMLSLANMNYELKPLRRLAGYSDEIAAEISVEAVPYKNRSDEIGALAQGLDRVVTLQEKLSKLAYSDEMTGLGNRARYLNDLEMALSKDVNASGGSVLVHIDLDNFKQINDAYGQLHGDKLLKLVAERLVDILPASSKVARIASDEFTILCEYRADCADKISLFEPVLAGLRKPFHLSVGEVQLTTSIGMIDLRHDARTVDEAHRNAGLALCRAKSDGGDQIVIFSSELNDAAQDQMRLARMIRSAISQREIALHYQPQIDPKTNLLVGTEALARWTHPTEGQISPGTFIPIAESSGLIVDLGSLVFDLACEQAALWRRQGFDFKHISVNVSPIQLWQPDFLKMVKSTLKRHQVPGKDIYIEITESVFVDHSEQRIEKILSGIRSLGVRLSLDDFGSGYSSLGYLNRLPFDQLKVDRSFVSGIDADQRKQRVLCGILELARGLGYDIIVEGAETLNETDLVSSMGCNAVQGFYFAKPVPASQFPEVINAIAFSGELLDAQSA